MRPENNCWKIACYVVVLLLAAHIGCFVGGDAYYVAFNSLGSLISEYGLNWHQRMHELCDPRLPFHTCMFVVLYYHGPVMTAFLAASGASVLISATFRNWIWVPISVFFSCACLQFIALNAWRV